MCSSVLAAPLSNEEMALKERESIDYSIRITKEMAEKGTAPRQMHTFISCLTEKFINHHLFKVRPITGHSLKETDNNYHAFIWQENKSICGWNL